MISLNIFLHSITIYVYLVTFGFSAMSQISGYKRSLSHANSIVVESNVPKFGVTSEHEEELAEVCIEFNISIVILFFCSKLCMRMLLSY